MTHLDAFQIISLVTGVATAIGVFFAAIQLRFSQENETTHFEDDMAREYREIIQRIPTRALLGETLSEEEFKQSFDEFYRYFSLSNEQVFLWNTGRIRPKTWAHWRVGIRSNLGRPAFRKAWDEIKGRVPESEFGGLRRVESNEV